MEAQKPTKSAGGVHNFAFFDLAKKKHSNRDLPGQPIQTVYDLFRGPTYLDQ
jgi:hypothetical protein